MPDPSVESQASISGGEALSPAFRAPLRETLGRVLKATGLLEVSYSHALTRAAGVWLHDVARHGGGTDWQTLEAAREVLFWRDGVNRTGQTLEIIRANPRTRFAIYSVGKSAWNVRVIGRKPKGWRDLNLTCAWRLRDGPQDTDASKVAAAILTEGATADNGPAAPPDGTVSAATARGALIALRPLVRLIAAEPGSREAVGPPQVPSPATLSLLALAAGAGETVAARARDLSARLDPLWRDAVALDLHLAMLGRPVADVPADGDARALMEDLDALIAAIDPAVGGAASEDTGAPAGRVDLMDDEALDAAFEAQLASLVGLNPNVAAALRQANAALRTEWAAVLWPMAPTVAPGARADSYMALLAVPVGLRVMWREPDAAGSAGDATPTRSRPDLADLRAADAVLAARLWDARAAALTANDAFTLAGALNVLPGDVEIVVWKETHRFDLLFDAAGAGFWRDLGYGLKGLAVILREFGARGEDVGALGGLLGDIGVGWVAYGAAELEAATAEWDAETVETMSEVGTGAALMALAVVLPGGTAAALSVQSLISIGRHGTVADAAGDIAFDVLIAGLGKLIPVIRGLSVNIGLRRQAVEAAATSWKTLLPRSDAAIAAGVKANARLRAAVSEASERYAFFVIDAPVEKAIEVGVAKAFALVEDPNKEKGFD